MVPKVFKVSLVAEEANQLGCLAVLCNVNSM